MSTKLSQTNFPWDNLGKAGIFQDCVSNKNIIIVHTILLTIRCCRNILSHLEPEMQLQMYLARQEAR